MQTASAIDLLITCPEPPTEPGASRQDAVPPPAPVAFNAQNITVIHNHYYVGQRATPRVPNKRPLRDR